MNRILFVLGVIAPGMVLAIFISIAIGNTPASSIFIALLIAIPASIGRVHRWRKLVTGTGKDPKWYQ